MHNIDYISEKWRTCGRTRKLAQIHIASSKIPIMYVAVYAGAQRRAEDNKKLGAALAALMFNVFQLKRTIMGLVQLNAFVAWCKHAVECIRVLQGNDYPSSWRRKRSDRNDTRSILEGVRQRMKEFVPWFAHASQGVDHRKVDDNDIEDVVMVNNVVVDSELGGREVTVLPSWKKVWGAVKQGRFTPSKWLRTDRVSLSTIRWGCAYLCGMGEHWNVHSIDNYADRSNRRYGEIWRRSFRRKWKTYLALFKG